MRERLQSSHSIASQVVPQPLQNRTDDGLVAPDCERGQRLPSCQADRCIRIAEAYSDSRCCCRHRSACQSSHGLHRCTAHRGLGVLEPLHRQDHRLHIRPSPSNLPKRMQRGRPDLDTQVPDVVRSQSLNGKPAAAALDQPCHRLAHGPAHRCVPVLQATCHGLQELGQPVAEPTCKPRDRPQGCAAKARVPLEAGLHHNSNGCIGNPIVRGTGCDKRQDIERVQANLASLILEPQHHGPEGRVAVAPRPGAGQDAKRGRPDGRQAVVGVEDDGGGNSCGLQQGPPTRSVDRPRQCQ
mmetsp:Transcript_150742/g.482360  ORF Transcript_150742/g.482360 Transcript_150742/m.482360 type:complete len:297 (-) Transcript_150742:223-1113(-)